MKQTAKSERHFVLDGQYEALFRANGIQVEEALRKANIPEDIFRRRNASMTQEQYFRFMDAVEKLNPDPELPIRLATSEHIESFSPPVFAAWCSKDGCDCIERLRQYKQLVGPFRYQTEETEDRLSVEFLTVNGGTLPPFLVKTEMAFLLHILRSATKETVNPVRVSMRREAEEAYAACLGCTVETGGEDSIAFRKQDMILPFISRNEVMWNYFEPELKRKLCELDAGDSVSARVRSALTELLPGGSGNVDGVAQKLGVSRRTLQRKLHQEGTTFQRQLDGTREALAKHYLLYTDLPAASITCLLGYREINSFQRSFSLWTGVTAREYREKTKDASV